MGRHRKEYHLTLLAIQCDCHPEGCDLRVHVAHSVAEELRTDDNLVLVANGCQSPLPPEWREFSPEEYQECGVKGEVDYRIFRKGPPAAKLRLLWRQYADAAFGASRRAGGRNEPS